MNSIVTFKLNDKLAERRTKVTVVGDVDISRLASVDTRTVLKSKPERARSGTWTFPRQYPGTRPGRHTHTHTRARARARARTCTSARARQLVVRLASTSLAITSLTPPRCSCAVQLCVAARVACPPAMASGDNASATWWKRQFTNLAVLELPGFIADFDVMILPHAAAVCGLVWVCLEHDAALSTTFSSVLIGIVAFPLTFAISASHGLRSAVLRDVASLESALWMLNSFHSEWDPLVARAPGHHDHNDACFRLILRLMRAIRCFATHRKRQRNVELENVYMVFRELRAHTAAVTSALVSAGKPVPAIIAAESTRRAVEAFENIRMSKDYPTPRSARQYHKVAGLILPLVLAPEFAGQARAHGTDWAAYVMAAVFTLFLGTLLSVAETLDNPFNCLEAGRATGRVGLGF